MIRRKKQKTELKFVVNYWLKTNDCLVLIEAACQHTKWILSCVRSSANKMLFSAQRIANANKILSAMNAIWLSCVVFIVFFFFFFQRQMRRRTRYFVLVRLWVWMRCANVGVIWYMELGEFSMLFFPILQTKRWALLCTSNSDHAATVSLIRLFFGLFRCCWCALEMYTIKIMSKMLYDQITQIPL